MGTAGCALMPRELNLSPIWFHRLDEHGEPLEWDCLWPILHYERTPAGGDDFRIRPLYRRVTEPEPEAVEHQFLWPLGRVRSDREETSQRLFPVWSYRSRINDRGLRDIDWYALFPFLFGGSSEDGREDYFAFLPFYADIPNFVTYDRFRAVLFPFYVALDKEGHRHTFVLWPLFGFSSCAEGDHDLLRLLPFYAHDREPGHFDRHWVLWPFLSWGQENLDSEDPVSFFWLWPFVGLHKGRDTDGWTVLWPFFEKGEKRDHHTPESHFYKLNLFWPFFHYYQNRAEDHVVQWWLWPFVGHTVSDYQDSWSFLWPLLWFRKYHDQNGRGNQEWVLPFFWHVQQEAKDGSSEDFVKIWPFAHKTVRRDADGSRIGGDWSILSPWPWREGNAVGVEEAYGWIWELAAGRQRARDDRAFDLFARLFTRRERHGETTASMPFLFNYERTAAGSTLRLLQFLPIPLGGPPSPVPTSAEARR